MKGSDTRREKEARRRVFPADACGIFSMEVSLSGLEKQSMSSRERAIAWGMMSAERMKVGMRERGLWRGRGRILRISREMKKVCEEKLKESGKAKAERSEAMRRNESLGWCRVIPWRSENCRMG
jgi:hypothetical protein